MIVFLRTLSRTMTTPCETCVSVPAHVSVTSHFVPRIVAALYRPVVWNAPLPLPNSRRDFGFFLAALAEPFFGHGASGSVSVRLVIPPDCVILTIAPLKVALSGGAPAFGTAVSRILPRLRSSVEPVGIASPVVSGWHLTPGAAQMSTVPWTGWTTTVLFGTGVGVGVGVTIGVGVAVGTTVGVGWAAGGSGNGSSSI